MQRTFNGLLYGMIERQKLADSTYWLLLPDTGQWKIRSLANVSLLA